MCKCKRGLRGYSGNSYKNYTALLSNTGNAEPPTAIVLENTLGGDITWSYVNDGFYNANSNGLFTLEKTFIQLTNSDRDWLTGVTMNIYSNGLNGGFGVTNTNFFTFTVQHGGGGINTAFTYIPIEVRVYN